MALGSGLRTPASGLGAIFVRASRCLSPDFAWWLGAVIGHALGGLPLRDARRAREHLAIAYPQCDAAWCARTARAAFRHFGAMGLWTVATLGRDPRRLRRGVMLEGRGHLAELARACRRGEGTVLFTGHVGNWELLGRACSTFIPLTVIGRRLRSPLAQALVEELRCSGGAQVALQDDDPRRLLGELRRGRAVATLVDQDIPRLAGVFVPWFGREAWTPVGPAALALASRVAVQPAFCHRRAGRWVVHLGPRRLFPRDGDRAAAARTLTAWVTAYQEAYVRRHPAQWAWWHKRWRTRPALGASE